MSTDKEPSVRECPRHCTKHDLSYTSIWIIGDAWSRCPACEQAAGKPGKPERGLSSVADLIAAPATREQTCDSHGRYSSRHYIGSVWSSCPECSEQAASTRKAQEHEAERERKIKVWREALGHSLIPERFRDRTLASYQAVTAGQKEALAFAKAYAADFERIVRSGRSALFLGHPGTGKTHLAIGIALEVMRDNRHTALFTTALRATRRIKDTWNKGSMEREAQAVAALVFPDLLILDEVGVQFGSAAEKTILFDVLNERYERCKPTLFLSNLELDEVKPFLGERIFDRLREAGGEYVPFTWASYRGSETE